MLTPMRRRALTRLITLAIILIASGLAILASGNGDLRTKIDEAIGRTPATEQVQGPTVTVSAEDLATAREQLADLTVAEAASMDGYTRDAFPHWKDPDGNGCDARDDTIIRDRASGTASGCDVTGGRWTDPYGGDPTTDPSSYDIDHLVPLANAWRSGANAWNTDRRERIANDPANLLAVSASLNRQKGDKGPEAWLPPNTGFHTAYAVNWIAVKHAYDLHVTQAEHDTLTDLLDAG